MPQTRTRFMSAHPPNSSSSDVPGTGPNSTVCCHCFDKAARVQPMNDHYSACYYCGHTVCGECFRTSATLANGF
ncbi:Protein of unknown function [Pyronema omphalodes CBS 100304]|uniref:Uncharacterized protein n=1 Tax=Pyronema omphalodes (strain CBS 100304) TaxID=1076935 RepID=U4LGT7_PYROM|nr:Protein of unknown function [Pyronema omphalodes CBS 100304]